MSDSGSSFGGRGTGDDGAGKRFAGAGGTPGGLGEFFIGVLLAAVGAYLLFSQVQVQTSYWRFGGMNGSFGITLIPLILGVGILFVNGRSTLGWVLSVGGFLFIVAGILLHLDVHFERTSLWNTLVMLALIAAGLGLVVKSLRPHGPRKAR